MKKNRIILLLAATLGVFASCSEPFDDTEIWESIEELRAKVTALETAVAENVSAIQSIVSVGSIASWEYDAQTGKAVIKLTDGKTVTIDQTAKGYSLITVEKDEDGNYYWAVCKDGVTVPLEIDGNKVPVTVTPSLKISEDKVWLISVDGGKTWVNTGIAYHEPVADDGKEDDEKPEPEPAPVFFQKVEQDGDFLILTLADGTEIKVAIVGEATFAAASDTLWYSRVSMEKWVAVDMVGVKAFTITEKPEGWKARMDEEYLYVTSPDNFAEFASKGTVKVLAVFENVQTPAILSIEVIHEPMFALSYVNEKVSVVLSGHTGEDFNGYVFGAWKKAEYTEEKAVEWFNTEAGNLVPFEGTESYTPSDIIPDYSSSEDYVVCAAPYLPAMQVSQGMMKYVSADLCKVDVKSAGASWTFSNVTYDGADLKAEMKAPFFGGFFKLEDWNNYGRDNFLETLKVGGATPYDIKSYNGPANGFPDGEVNLPIGPATEYVVWYLPEKESGSYAAEDFFTDTFKTPDVTADASIAAPTYVVRDVNTAGFTADVTPAAGAYKTYAAIVKAAVVPESDIEIVRYLVGVNKYSSGQAVNTVSNYSVSSEDEVYLLAVSVTKDGKYGKIVKEKVEIKDLSFTDALGVEVTDIEYGVGDVTLSLSFKGNPESITYFAETDVFYSDEVLERLLALGQYGNAKNVKVSTLDGKIYLNELTLGAEYTFYAVVLDAEGNSSHLYTTTFVPSISIDYVLSDSADYEYGMPELTGTCKGGSNYTLTLDVEKPAECKKYWLFKGNYEYFTGDIWTDSDKLVTEQFMDVTVHDKSETGLTYSFMNATSRIYMVWLDDKGNYHAIYEYNPKAN